MKSRNLFPFVNPIALRKVKIVYNFGLSECNRVKNWQKDMEVYPFTFNLQKHICSTSYSERFFFYIKKFPCYMYF